MRARSILSVTILITCIHVGMRHVAARSHELESPAGKGSPFANDTYDKSRVQGEAGNHSTRPAQETSLLPRRQNGILKRTFRHLLREKTPTLRTRTARRYHKHRHHPYVDHIFSYNRHLRRYARYVKNRRKRRAARGDTGKRHRAQAHIKTSSKRTSVHSKNDSKLKNSEQHYPTTKRQYINHVDVEREKINGATNKEDNEEMVMSDSLDTTKRNRVHMSPVLLNAIQLVLDNRNYFKDDANALQLANALQIKKGNANGIARSNLMPGVKHGVTRNGYQARMVRVKDSGYDKNVPRIPLERTGYRRRVVESKKIDPLSHLVNPTELGISILKLLFGKRAYLVTDSMKHPTEVQGAKLDVRLLAGYGTHRQRAQLQNKIENENQMILLKGVRKEEFTKSLARSISDLIKAMTKGDDKSELGRKLSPAKDLSVRKTRQHSTADENSTRKSWVLLKIPKSKTDDLNNGRGDNAPGNAEEETRPQKPRITTFGKHSNALTEVQAVRRPKHKSASYEIGGQDTESRVVPQEPKVDFTQAVVHAAKEKSRPIGEEKPYVDTDVRAVPQVISSTKQKLRVKEEPSKVDSNISPGSTGNQGLSPATMAFSLSKILQAIESSIKELRGQQKDGPLESKPVITSESPMKSTALAAMTVPERLGPPKSQLETPVATPSSDVTTQTPVTTLSSEVTTQKPVVAPPSSDVTAGAIPDLLSAIQKLVGAKGIQPRATSQSGFAKIPSDDPAKMATRYSPSASQVDVGTRRFSGMLGTEDIRPQAIRPLVIQPAGASVADEGITSTRQMMQAIQPAGASVADEGITSTRQMMQPGDNVLFESDDELGTPRDRQATTDAIKLKEDLEAFAEKGLQAHNRYRSDHHSPPLKWSDDLATQAEKLAYDMAMKGAIERSEVASNLGYGENVAKISGTSFNKAGQEATNLWYGEGGNYSFSDPRLSPRTDAFTQVIWKASKKLGMGCARDLQTNDLYVVALYDPKGNDPVVLRSNVVRTGGVVQDVYASIFKRFKLHPKSGVPTIGMFNKTIEQGRT